MRHDLYELCEPDTNTQLVSTTAAEFWTAAKLEEVQPLPLPEVTAKPRRSVVRLPKFFDSIGKNDRPQRVLPIPARDLLPLETLATARTTPVRDRATLPFAVVGKLRMAFPNGAVYQGSAFVLGNKAIITAGHCVYDARYGGWASNIQFMPQYANGATIGTWNVTLKTTLKEYVSSNNLDFDVAACILDREIGTVTGIAGYQVNQPLNRGAIVGVGYPASPTARHAFNGEQMWQSVGEVIRDEKPGTTDDRTYGMANDMTGGCSGGPWFAPGTAPVACGLNSHIITNEIGTMYSPYFGKAFLRLLDWLQTNGGEPNPGTDTKPKVKSLKESLSQISNELQEVIRTLS